MISNIGTSVASISNCGVFIGPHDIVIVENPVYLEAFGSSAGFMFEFIVAKPHLIKAGMVEEMIGIQTVLPQGFRKTHGIAHIGESTNLYGIAYGGKGRG